MLEVKNIRKSFASSEVQVLKDISFNVKTGEFVCLLGKSGCGKSTLLDLLAGYTKPDGGELILDGKKIKGPGIDRGLVFQEHALYPWYTVYQNICFGPKIQKKKNYTDLANEYLEMIGMKKYKDYYPDSLSGGMKQRVGIARALAAEPDVLLMDEPFSALDPSTRVKLRDDLIDIWKKTSKTIIFVTHSVPEAVYLADRVIAMKDGTIQFNEVIDIERKRDMNDPRFIEYVNKIESFISNKKGKKDKKVHTKREAKNINVGGVFAFLFGLIAIALVAVSYFVNIEYLNVTEGASALAVMIAAVKDITGEGLGDIMTRLFPLGLIVGSLFTVLTFIASVFSFKGKYPILGVCLGHQAICETFGATVDHASKLMHGKMSIADIDTSSEIFKGLDNMIEVARYHSLAAVKETIPDCLKITAKTDEGDVMAVEHKDYPIYGVQFHPESILTPDGMIIIDNFLKIRV